MFEIYTAFSYVHVASYTSHALPCLNIKHVAVKVISKDQQTLKQIILLCSLLGAVKIAKNTEKIADEIN